jgi:hypothetical protein
LDYISNVGRDAVASAMQERVDYSKALKTFKSGVTLKVRVLSTEDVQEYYAHSVYKKINTTPCFGKAHPDYYDEAVEILYQEARAAEASGDEKGAKELRDSAYMLKAKQRYLIGFVNLEDGKQIVIDVSKNQEKTIMAHIDKSANKLGNKWFELKKTGSGKDSMVMISAEDLEDLTDAERKHFDEANGTTFNKDVFGKLFAPRSPKDQLNDLRNFGFDVSKLTGVTEVTAHTQTPPAVTTPVVEEMIDAELFIGEEEEVYEFQGKKFKLSELSPKSLHHVTNLEPQNEYETRLKENAVSELGRRGTKEAV